MIGLLLRLNSRYPRLVWGVLMLMSGELVELYVQKLWIYAKPITDMVDDFSRRRQ